jgi:hypothetical protein
MAKSSILQLSPAIRPIVISKPNFELLLREGRSFEEYFRYQEDESVKETEDNVLNQTEETNGQENTEEDKTAPQPTEEDTDNVD